MAHVIYNTATTLDGFLADGSHSLEWLFAVPGAADAENDFDTFLAEVAVIVMGSSTYEWVVEHQRLVEDPAAWTRMYGSRPTFVFSSRARPAIEGADIRFASGAVVAAWDEIRDAAGAGIVWIVGGGDLVGQFADAGLLDEVRVSVAPVTLGAGRPLLPRRIESDVLLLTEVRRVGQFAELVYAVRRSS